MGGLEVVPTDGGREQIRTQVKVAEKTAKGAMKFDSYFDLDEQRPELAKVIDAVADSFGVPRSILRIILHRESRFQHGYVGDRNLEGMSIGIGQFRPSTWSWITRQKEYKNFMENNLGKSKFERGESLLADIAASAQLIKHIAKGHDIEFSDDMKPEDLIIIRARYLGMSGSKTIAKNYKRGKKIPDNLAEFLDQYENLNSEYIIARQKKYLAQLAPSVAEMLTEPDEASEKDDES